MGPLPSPYLLFQSKIILFLAPANCSAPTAPESVTIEPYQNTTEGAEIAFMCNPGFIPADKMIAVCTVNGSWNPDPATTECSYIG